MATVTNLRPRGSRGDRSRLYQIIKQRSFREGEEFTLSSGRKANFYFNLKPTLAHPEGVSLAAQHFLEEAYASNPDYIGGMELGATQALGAIASLSFVQSRPAPTLLVRKARKDHGTMLRVEGLATSDNLKGKKVVLIDDVATGGGSLYSAVEAILEEGGKVDTAIVLVNRDEGATEHLEERGIKLKSIFHAREFLSPNT